MLHIFPVSKSDAHLIDPLHSAIKALGGLKGRKCLVIGDQNARDSVEWMANRIENLNGIATTQIFPFNCDEGWPRACNRYFSAAMQLANGQTDPFYFFELDNTPIRPGWLERVEGEYMNGLSQGKFFMGHLSTYFDNRMGRMVENGQIMNGSGVYPPNFVQVSQLVQDIGRINIPWDIHMRWEIVNQTHDASRFILFNWKTTNYRWENGQIVCDIFDRPDNLSHSGRTEPITSETLIVHGCKDGSLAALVVAGAIDAPPFTEKTAPIEISSPSPTPAAVDKPRVTPKKTAPSKKKAKEPRKLNLTPAERERRSEHARNLAKTRKPARSKILPMSAAAA